MRSTTTTLAALQLFCLAAASTLTACAGTDPITDARVTADAVRFNEAHPNDWRAFAPEAASMLQRAPALDPETGLHVSEIEPDLFFVTDGVYQSAFLLTEAGVVVFDAPPSFAERLRPAISAVAPTRPITTLIYSHDHADHIGGAFAFEDVAGLEIIASDGVAADLVANPLRGVLAPTKTFADEAFFNIGGIRIDLRTTSFHSEDEDVLIYLPEKSFLMAIDTITPGEAPFMNFGATSDFGRYLDGFDIFLEYQFKHFLSGHVSVLGTRNDVVTARAYAFDVRDAIASRMSGFMGRFQSAFESMGFKNPNLGYRAAIEQIRDECADEIIEAWSGKLSVVDVWADSHCETAILYMIMH